MAKIKELNQIIKKENLNKTKTYNFVNSAFRDGFVRTTGTAISEVIPPVSMFTKDNKRDVLIQRVLDKITNFFEKFKNISSAQMKE